MTEAEMWQVLRAAAVHQNLWPERYENVASYGTFDTSISWKNRTAWIELKSDVRKELKLSQRRWARKRYECGCYNDMWIVFIGKTHGWWLQPAPLYLQHDKLSYEYAAEFTHVAHLLDHIVVKMEKEDGSSRVLPQ